MKATHKPGHDAIPVFLRFLLLAFLMLNMAGCKSCRNSSHGAETPADGTDNAQTSYTWSTGDWEACSAPCGGGVQQRAIFCRDQNGLPVDESLCNAPEPESQRPCNTQACPPAYEWYEGDCTDCELVDGRCRRTCDVYCRSGQGERVDDVYCAGEKPAAEKPCQESACADAATPVYRWLPYPFGQCSETCGGGKQFRTVVCVDGHGQLAADALCDPAIKPTTEQDCNPFPCAACDNRIAAQPAVWPAPDWQAAAIEAHGFPADAFDTLDADLAADLPFVTSFMVIRDGYILHETYQTPSDRIVAYSNADNYFVWRIPNMGYQRISWVDETATPVTFQMHIPAADPAIAVWMPPFPGREFTLTRVESGAPGGMEVAGVWTGSGDVFGIFCYDVSLTPLPFFLTLTSNRIFYHCGTPAVDVDTAHSLFSVTKSVTSLTYGAAWQNGLIDFSALSTTVNNAFSDLITDFAADDLRRDISLLDVLQMRSGLEWNETKDLTGPNNPIANPDPNCANDETVTLCSVLRMPLAYAPGTVWNYSEPDSYLAGAFFHYLTSQSLRDYAGQYLFSPIGITFDSSQWVNVPVTPANTAYTHGGAGLFLRTRDVARLGLLTLYDGCWNGRQILSYDWLQQTQTPIGAGLALMELDGNLDFEPPLVVDIQYGLHWWLTTGPFFSGAPLLNARGLGGQFIYVFKDMEMVIVVTSNVLSAPIITNFTNQSASIWDFVQINIMNKMLDGTMIDIIEVAGDWTGTDAALCSDPVTSAPIPFFITFTNDQLSFTCDGATQAGNIVRCRNTENYCVWHMPDGNFQRFSWVDETAAPVTFQAHDPAGDLETAAQMPPSLAFDMTKTN